MKLPVLDTYAFPVTLPSSGQTINMRPFLVREEKLLLMARESENYEDQVEAVSQVIINCTNGAVNPRLAPYFDIEYLLLQLRARSVGEIVSPVYKCHNILEGTTEECGHETTVKIDITKVTVNNLSQSKEHFIIPISDDYRLNLKYPTVYTIHQLINSTVNNENTLKSQLYLETLCDVFDTLEELKTGVVYQFSDYTLDEKMQFMESLSGRTLELASTFLTSLPTVSTTLAFTCDRCQFAHNIPVAGITNFLD